MRPAVQSASNFAPWGHSRSGGHFHAGSQGCAAFRIRAGVGADPSVPGCLIAFTGFYFHLPDVPAQVWAWGSHLRRCNPMKAQFCSAA
jgi:hypothetical protein